MAALSRPSPASARPGRRVRGGAHQPQRQLAGQKLVAGQPLPRRAAGREPRQRGRPVRASRSLRSSSARRARRSRSGGSHSGKVGQPRARAAAHQRPQPALAQALRQPVDGQQALARLARLEQLGVGDLPLLAVAVEAAVDRTVAPTGKRLVR